MTGVVWLRKGATLGERATTASPDLTHKDPVSEAKPDTGSARVTRQARRARLSHAIRRQAVRLAAEERAKALANLPKAAETPIVEGNDSRGGRPALYDKHAVLHAIVAEMARGKTLHEASVHFGLKPATVRQWCYGNPALRAILDAGRAAYADALAERVIRESLKAQGKSVSGVAAQRLTAESLKWLVSRIDPARYGNTMAVSHSPQEVRVVFESPTPVLPSLLIEGREGIRVPATLAVEGNRGTEPRQLIIDENDMRQIPAFHPTDENERWTEGAE